MFETLSASLDKVKFKNEFSQLAQMARTADERQGALTPESIQLFLDSPLPRQKEFWLLKEGQNIIATLGANVSESYPDFLYIGFFEYVGKTQKHHQLLKNLFDLVFEWGRQRNCKQAYGPLNFNTWFQYRFKRPSQDSLFFAWEPTNPSFYRELWLEQGFQTEMLYHSTEYADIEQFAKRCQSDYHKALQKGFTLRPLVPEKLLTNEIHDLYRISMKAFQDNFLFEPLPFELFKILYAPLAQHVQFPHARMILNPEQQAVGFIFCFNDQNRLVHKTIAVDPAMRGEGLSNALIYESTTAAQNAGLKSVIAALVKSGAQSESYGKTIATTWKHEYELLNRSLVD